ncbi:MAG: hypothetical protein K0U66_10915, partial [Gammaproteobacteria bacterium]|nr:hypothetical protein [Gammaproteobacteria bacterium]
PPPPPPPESGAVCVIMAMYTACRPVWPSRDRTGSAAALILAIMGWYWLDDRTGGVSGNRIGFLGRQS